MLVEKSAKIPLVCASDGRGRSAISSGKQKRAGRKAFLLMVGLLRTNGGRQNWTLFESNHITNVFALLSGTSAIFKYKGSSSQKLIGKLTSRSFNIANAFARWLNRFFVDSPSWANDFSNPFGTKSGSYPKPPSPRGSNPIQPSQVPSNKSV